MAVIELTVPDIGDVSDAAVIELLVKPGDAIKAEQSLITIESDKASMEVPSPLAGEVLELLVKTGDSISQGDKLLLVKGAAAPASTATAASPAAASATLPISATAKASAPQRPPTTPAGLHRSTVYVGPGPRQPFPSMPSVTPWVPTLIPYRWPKAGRMSTARPRNASTLRRGQGRQRSAQAGRCRRQALRSLSNLRAGLPAAYPPSW